MQKITIAYRSYKGSTQTYVKHSQTELTASIAYRSYKGSTPVSPVEEGAAHQDIPVSIAYRSYKGSTLSLSK